MKTRNDILPLIAAVAFAITTLQGATPEQSSVRSDSISGTVRAFDTSATLAAAGVDFSQAQSALAVALIQRLQGKGVDIS